MNRLASVVALGLLAGGAALFSPAAPPAAAATADSASTASGGATLVTLKNGLRLVLAPDPLALAVDVTVWYDAGSRYDRPGKTGVAHLFEHLMFRGSAKFGAGEHGRRVRAEGGSSGAIATPDLTAFYETLPPDAVELAFQLEADRMTTLQLTQSGLDLERSQLAGERARRATPVGIGLDLLYAKAWEGHPYARSLYGSDADVARLTIQDLRDFYRARFGPDRALVTVVGRFDPAQVTSLARKYFEPLKPTGSRPETAPSPRPQDSERRAHGTAPASLRIVMVGWRVPPRTDADWPAFNLLGPLLTRANDAPLARALIVDRRLCASVQGDVDSRREGSVFYLAAPVLPDADSTEVEDALFRELGRLLVEPVKAADLERAKRQTETAVWTSLETVRGRAQALGSAAVLAGDPNDMERQMKRMRAVTAEDVRRAASRLDPARRVVVWLAPGGGAAAAAGGPR